MKKQCVICGADFNTQPSSGIVTCSPACRAKRLALPRKPFKTNKGEDMGKRHSIYLADEAETIIQSFGDSSLSGAISALLIRYAAIANDACLELSEPEWSMICDVLNGCGALLSAGGQDQAIMAWASIADAEQHGTGEKWGVSCAEVAAKVRALPLAGKIAVWDVAARFWASPRLNELSTLDLLIESGAKVRSNLIDATTFHDDGPVFVK